MSTPTAILAGLALVAIAIYAASGSQPLPSTGAIAADADDQANGKGAWAFRGHGEQLLIWKMNAQTGDLYACTHKTRECIRVGAN
jgi:hypothetical protein